MHPSTTASERRRWPRRLLIALGVVAALVLIGRLALDPLAARFLTKGLAKNPDFQGAFDSVHVSVIPPALEIRKLKIIERPGGRWDEPLAYVEYARTSLLWRQLIRGHVVAQARLEKPKIIALRQHEQKAKKAPEAKREIDELLPVKLDLVEVVDGEVLVGIGKGKQAPQMWIHDMDLIARNMATRKAMMESEPSTMHMTARVQKSGKLKLDAEMDPWAKQLTFSAKSSLVGLKAEELYAFMAREDIQAESGSIDLFVEMRARNGVLRGGVKPMLKGIEVRSKGDGLGDRLKAALADASIELLSDDLPERDAVATTIPIRGKIDDPHVQLLPTILGVVRNAFVTGLRSGFTNLPPPVAEKKENPVKQAWDALTSDDKPPEAQPEKGDEARKNEARKNEAEASDDKRAASTTPRRGRADKRR